MKYAALVSEKKVADPSCRGSARGEMKAIQNSVSRGWASGTRRDPHPSTSGTVPGPYEHVLPRAAALDEVLRLGQRKGVFFLPKRLCREVHLEQLSTLWRVDGRATYRSQHCVRCGSETRLHRGRGSVVASATTAVLKLAASRSVVTSGFSPPASLRGTSADRRHRKRPSRCMFRAGDDDGAVRRPSR